MNSEPKYFMNPFTGSVDTWENWCEEQKASIGTEYEWPKSDLDTLIEVVPDGNGGWTEAE